MELVIPAVYILVTCVFMFLIARYIPDRNGMAKVAAIIWALAWPVGLAMLILISPFIMMFWYGTVLRYEHDENEDS